MTDKIGHHLSQIVLDIQSSFEEIGGINHIEGANLPSKYNVVSALEDLISLIFPGYYSSEALDDSNIGYYVGEKCSLALKKLAPEICKSLHKECPNGVSCLTTGNCKFRGHEIAVELLQEIPNLRRKLCMDVEATFGGDPASRSRDEIILCYPGLEAITVYRIAHFLFHHDVPLIPRIMTEHIHGKTGIDIHPAAHIGEYFFIDHGTGVVIGETCIIGNHVKIYQGVTLGALSVRTADRGVKRHPTIENDVTIYSGATILGGDTVIGAGSVIGGNVWLTHSVPPGSKVTARSEIVEYPPRIEPV